MSARRPGVRAVTVIGIGDDGCLGLSSRAVNAAARAEVLVGGERQLAFFPQWKGERIVLKGGLGAALDRVAALADEHNVCVLASGDPLFFGIGARVVERVGREHVEVIPHPSSVAWAFARAGLRSDDATVLSLHGRPREGFAVQVRTLDKVAVLTDEENSPPQLASHLMDYGQHDFRAWVCENLAGPDERVRSFTLPELAKVTDITKLNVLLLVREPARSAQGSPPTIAYLHEDAFAKRMPKKGLITKREVRLLSLAAMNLRPASVVWDIGAGSGSVAIEAALLAPRGRVYAIEVDPEGVAICRENVLAHGTDNVRVVAGRAPEALEGLEAPDAVFVGGSKGAMEPILKASFDRLTPGGRLVVNAITLDSVAEAYRVFRSWGITPEVTLLQIARGEPLASYLRYEALNPIHTFAVQKPEAA